MNKKDKEQQRYLIIDSTAIIHVLSKEKLSDDNVILIFPEGIKNEMRSFQAKSVLESLKEDKSLIFTNPTLQSVNRVELMAEETQDIVNLSKTDIQVIALALDYQNATVISDDNGIQNVCYHLGIPVLTYSFKIRKAREYFWKCTVCGQKYKRKQDLCIECGSPTKRLFLSKTKL